MTLKIYLLGQFRLQSDDEPIELPSRPAQSLLAYLVMNAGIPHRREKLAGLLWPDSAEENARGYLRQALWRIRKSLDENDLQADSYLETDKINITFKTEADYWLDTRELLRDTHNLSLEEIGSILKLYHGELLPGFYDEWVSSERERLQASFHQKIDRFVDELTLEQRWDLVREWAETWIRLAPVPEAAFRALMSAYAASGDQAMLMSTYERCQKTLEDELGVEISSATMSLYQDLCQQLQCSERPPRGQKSEVALSRPTFLNSSRDLPTETPIFVARQAEMQLLSTYLQDMFAGNGKVVFITGEAGSGKTALLDAFIRTSLDNHPDLIVTSGHGNAQTGIGDPYLPMRELIGMLAGDFEARLEAGTLTQDHAERLWNNLPVTIEALASIGPDLLDTFIPSKPLFERATYYPNPEREAFDKLRSRLEQKAPTRSTPGTKQTDLFEQYTRVLAEISRHSPLMLILDDLQWVDAGSIQLLFHLGREIGHYPILIVGAFRQEELALGRDGDRHPLEPVINEFQRLFGTRSINLEQCDQAEFIEALLDSEPNLLGKSFREMLHRQTLGHPLFTIELLRAMQDSKDLIVDKSGRWIEGADLDWERMPARVEAVVAERIERLSPSEKAVLRTASVEGEIFTAEVLSRVLGMEENELLRILSIELDRTHRLIRTESIERIGDQLFSRYQFRHAIFQKYLYNSLDEVELVHYHQEIGFALEKLCAHLEDKSFVDLSLARHFEIAGILDKAIDYYHRVGDRAIILSGYAEGIANLQKALDLLLKQPETETRNQVELTLQLSVAMSWKYNWVSIEGTDTINRIRYLCDLLDQISPLAQIYGELSTYNYVQAKYNQSLDYAVESLRIAEQVEDPLLTAVSHWRLGYLYFGLGDCQTALTHLNLMDEFYDPAQHHNDFLELCGVDAGLSAQGYRACSLWCLGYPDQAIEIGRTTIELAKEYSHPFTIADVLSYAGCLLHTMLRDTDALSAFAQELVDLSEEVSLSLSGWLGLSRCFLGDAMTSNGEINKAILEIQTGLEESRATGVNLYLPMALRFLARAQLISSDLDSAMTNLNYALETIDLTGERIWEVDLYRHRGLVHLAAGDTQDAQSDFNKALELSREQNAKSWELRVTMDLARLWADEGQVDRAHKLLHDCYAWFTEGFETPDLIEAATLLDHLSE
ncbi:MAG: AAA family ATPase [Anaerolineales bacterium]